MQSTPVITLTVVVLVAVTGLALAQDGCIAQVFHGSDCCDTSGFHQITNQEIIDECSEKYLGSNPPQTYSEMMAAHACAKECILSREGLLTSDHKLDKAAITKFVSPYEAVFGPAMYTFVDTCFDSSQANVDSSLECKSGSNDFLICFFRETFLNCPSSIWSATSECDELKVNVTKCPKNPVEIRKAK